MALENYIINASNTGAAGYHNAMAGMDQRKREAEVDRHNAYIRQKEEQGYRDKKMREAFEMAALMDVGETNNGPALDYLDRVSDELGVQRPDRNQIGPALKTYRSQVGSGDAYGSIVYGEDAEGNPVVMQPTRGGGLIRPPLPEGVARVTLPTRDINLNDRVLQVPSRGAGGPVNVYEKGVSPDQQPSLKGEQQAEIEKAKTEAIPARAPLAAAAAAAETSAVETSKFAAASSQAAFESLAKVRASVGNIDDAIRAIDSGAGTGPVVRMLPNVKAASVELANIRGRMGLDIVGATTFGALSEAELAFALDVALPTNMSPPALRDWLTRKREAQMKLAAQLEDAAIFLAKPGATASLYLEYIKGKNPRTSGAPSVENAVEVDPALFEFMTPEDRALFP